MSATQRGAAILLGVVVFISVCAFFTFSFLPSNGISVALPVITVPGEAFNGATPSSDSYGIGNLPAGLTNTFLAILVADVAVIAFIVLARRATNNFTREVPTRFGSIVEMIGDFLYGQAKSFVGTAPIVKRWIFPFAATIFVLLLAANWMKLLPGVESVGLLHCAHAGFSGYPAREVGPGYQLYVNSPLNSGVRATEEDYHACEHFMAGTFPTEAELNTAADSLAAAEAALVAELNQDTNLSASERDERINAVRLENIEPVYHHAHFPITADELRSGIRPYIMVITPWIRGASTDLNLTVGLALVAVVAIQIFGVVAQGPNYFQKFVNLRALGNLKKKPLGAIDFVVGIFEIISEFAKIISLAFRLFGNMFAGGVLLAVMSFLIAAFLPVIFIGLEIIITSVQAYVFAVLTLVFVGQAMHGHHGDDDEHEGHAAEGHAAEHA